MELWHFPYSHFRRTTLILDLKTPRHSAPSLEGCLWLIPCHLFLFGINFLFTSIIYRCKSPAGTANTWQEDQRNRVNVHLPYFNIPPGDGEQSNSMRCFASTPGALLSQGSTTCLRACSHRTPRCRWITVLELSLWQ